MYDVVKWIVSIGTIFKERRVSKIMNQGERSGMNFSQALDALIAGSNIRRSIWPMEQYLYQEECYAIVLGHGGMKHKREYQTTFIKFLGDNKHQAGWCALPDDMLANDWSIV